MIRRVRERKLATLGHDDPGLQPERTVLAWRRTLMTLLICCTLFLRWIPHFGLWALMPTIVALAACMLVQVGLNARYRKSTKGLRLEYIPAPLREVVVLGMTVIVLSLIGVYAVVFP